MMNDLDYGIMFLIGMGLVSAAIGTLTSPVWGCFTFGCSIVALSMLCYLINSYPKG
jgi:hypothetical protein